MLTVRLSKVMAVPSTPHGGRKTHTLHASLPSRLLLPPSSPTIRLMANTDPRHLPEAVLPRLSAIFDQRCMRPSSMLPSTLFCRRPSLPAHHPTPRSRHCCERVFSSPTPVVADHLPPLLKQGRSHYTGHSAMARILSPFWQEIM